LDELSKRHKRFRVHYIIDKPEPGWDKDTGYVSANMIKKHLPPPEENAIVMVCGPPGMMKFVSGEKGEKGEQGELKGLLKDLGYPQEKIFKF